MRSNPGVHLAVLGQCGVERASTGPLQDEAEGLEDHSNEVYDVGMVEFVEQRHLGSHLQQWVNFESLC